MKIEISPLKIKKDPRNQVTSSATFLKNQRKCKEDYLYDDKGIFSRKIFGYIGTCECGNQTEPGYCELCGSRVVDANNMPDFFIDLGVVVPKLYADFKPIKNAEKLLTYKAFLVVEDENEELRDSSTVKRRNKLSYRIIDSDNDEEVKTIKDMSKVKIGVDAARFLYPNKIDEWLDKYATDFISVPHTVYRANVRLDNGRVKFNEINTNLVELLQNIERIEQYLTIFENEEVDNYFILSFYSEIYDHYIKCMKTVYRLFCGGKQSFLGSDMRAHRVTNAVKGTIVNRFDIDEDIVIIGDTFIQTLYPYIYKKFDGDMEKINDYFIDSNAVVLLNRPPTICMLSIMALKPRVASCYKFGTFGDGAVGKNKKSDYCEEVDTIGIRTIGISPIITDGLAGDFDGDCVLIISLFSDKAKEEAYTMLPSKCYMNYANGNVRNVIPEDIVYAEGK